MYQTDENIDVKDTAVNKAEFFLISCHELTFSELLKEYSQSQSLKSLMR